jgi:VanZ family protein
MTNLFLARGMTLALLIYWLALVVGTHLPSSAVGPVRVTDKPLHFGAYAGLAVLLAGAVLSYCRGSIGLLLALFWVLALHGALDEVGQLAVRGRSADVRDWAADVLGAAAGLLLVSLVWTATSPWRSQVADG